MVAIALAWVLVPLLRRGTPGIAREVSNVAILRDQLRELDADLAAGTMPRDRYEQAKRELEAGRSKSRSEIRGTAARPSQSAAWTAAIIAGAIPIAALLLYVVLGNHEAFAPIAAQRAKGAAEHEVTPQEVEAMAAKLAARLRERARQCRRVGDARAHLLRAQSSCRGGARLRSRDRARSRQRRSARRLRRLAGRRRGRTPRQVARAHRARAQGRSDALEGAGARRHGGVQSQGLQGRGRVLGADEGDRSARLSHCRVDRRQHRRGAGAGRPARPRPGARQLRPPAIATCEGALEPATSRKPPRRPARRSAAR